jgi:hypothetical protein
VPKPHHDQLQHQQQRRTDFITNVPRSESKISDSERVVIDFKGKTKDKKRVKKRCKLANYRVHQMPNYAVYCGEIINYFVS